MPDIEMRSVRELWSTEERERTYVIPAYQRGYRWTKEEVEDLIDDLLQFTRSLAPEKDSKYCLQPLIVKHRDEDRPNEYRVVDGQQRLTTIWLMIALVHHQCYSVKERSLYHANGI